MVWAERLAKLWLAGTSAKPRENIVWMPRLSLDTSGRFLLRHATTSVDGGMMIFDAKTGATLWAGEARTATQVVSLVDGFAFFDLMTKRLILLRSADGKTFAETIAEPFDGALFIDLAPSVNRVFLRRGDPIVLAVWPSLEVIAQFRGNDMRFDWEARRVISREDEQTVLYDLDGNEVGVVNLPHFGRPFGRLAPGVWANYGDELGIVLVAEGRTIEVLPATQGRHEKPSLSADGRALRVLARGRAFRIEVDLAAEKISLPKELVDYSRYEGTRSAMFHPYADLVAREERGTWSLHSFDGKIVFTFPFETVPKMWTEDGGALVAALHGVVQIWRA